MEKRENKGRLRAMVTTSSVVVLLEGFQSAARLTAQNVAISLARKSSYLF
jgi:hypothetical protein